MMHRAHLNALSLVLAVAVVFSDIQPGYLDFDNLPETNFSCDGKVIGGYYADVETGCQMFHVCTIGQKGETSDIKFLCLNGTVFDQETRVCERIDEVECDKSEDFFNLNLELYGNTPNFGAQEECSEDDCDEEEEEEEGDDTEYDDDTESTTILTTTTEPTTTTTTTRPTTVRTTQPPTPPRTVGYTRYTTHQPDNIASLLALHNAFNQGFNRRPALNAGSSTRLPLITSTTTRRPTGGLTVRTRFGTPEHQNRPDEGYVLRPRPTFHPTFSSSSQPPLKSNYHTFESGDTHFSHSFDPDKPFHFQYFAQKSSPSPFTVRIEPEVSVVTSTSTSTSIRIANTTVDESPYEDYDGYDPFFHDVQKITRPKRSTTQRSSSSRLLKSSPDLDLDNAFLNAPSKRNETTDEPDHVIKIDPSDVLISKNYTSDSPGRKTEYLDNLLDSIVMEDGEKKRVVELIRNSEPEMEKLISNKGVDLMLEQLENRLLEMELEGRGSGVAFEYEGDSVEIREKRGSEDKSSVGNYLQLFDKLDREKSDEILCTNPEFCVSSPLDEGIRFEIEDRKKRSTKTRGDRLGDDSDTRRSNRRRADPESEEEENFNPVHSRRRTTEAPTRTTKRSRRKGARPGLNKSDLETHDIITRPVTESSRRKNYVERSKPSTTTDRPDIKPVTEEIENDITTAEYRRPPLSVHGERKKHPYSEHTTPFSVPSSTRLQTRFDYENRKTIVTTKRTTKKPTYFRQVPVYEEYDYQEIVQRDKKKSHKVRRRSPIIVRDDEPLIRLPRDDEEEVKFESVPIRRTKARPRTSQVTRQESEYRAPSPNRNPNAQIPSRTRGVEHDSVAQTRTRSSLRTRNRPSAVQTEPAHSRPTVQQAPTSFRLRTPSADATVRQNVPSLIADEGYLDVGSSSTDVPTSGNVDIPVKNGRDFDNIKTSIKPLFREDISEVRFSPDRPVYTPAIVDGSATSTRLGKVPDERPSYQNVRVRAQHNQNTQQIGRTRKVKDSSQIRHSPDPPTVQYEINSQDYSVPVQRLANTDQQPRSTPNQNDRQIGRRTKVVRNRNRFSDPPVIRPEEMTYLTPVADSSLARPAPQTYNSRDILESERVEVPTTTLAPTTYAPAPGVEADPNFSCRGKVKGGLYADVYSDCHGFFICSQAKRGISATHFWCGVGTRFNQVSRTCQTAAQVDCSEATRLYHLNDNQYTPSIDFEDKLRGSFEPMRV